MTAHQENYLMACTSDNFILEFNSLLIYETQNWEIFKSAYNWPQNYKHRIDDQSVDVHKARGSYTDRFCNKKYILFCSFLPVSTKYLSHYGIQSIVSNCIMSKVVHIVDTLNRLSRFSRYSRFISFPGYPSTSWLMILHMST